MLLASRAPGFVVDLKIASRADMILYVMYENAMSILKLVRLSQVDQRTSRVDCSCVQCSMDQGASLEGLLGL